VAGYLRFRADHLYNDTGGVSSIVRGIDSVDGSVFLLYISPDSGTLRMGADILGGGTNYYPVGIVSGETTVEITYVDNEITVTNGEISVTSEIKGFDQGFVFGQAFQGFHNIVARINSITYGSSEYIALGDYGDTELVDHSGNGNDATINGTTWGKYGIEENYATQSLFLADVTSPTEPVTVEVITRGTDVSNIPDTINGQPVTVQYTYIDDDIDVISGGLYMGLGIRM